MKKNKLIHLSGRVQNVGFRYSTMQVARQYGITGFVKNNVDGTVTIEAEGEEENLNQFVEWAKQGPPPARIDHANIQESPVQDYQEFRIK
ncbi:MAG: acylphosphatase [Bacteroidales bacterium]|nr:acylphosphatase [Bacteroidales bacterium]